MRALLGTLPLCLLCACATETRVIRTGGGLQDLPGAEGGVRAQRPYVASDEDPDKVVDPSNPMGYTSGPTDETLRERLPDNTWRLVSRNPRELMFHLRKTIQDGERELLLGQVLSERTREAYREKGLDPKEAVEFLIKHQNEIIRLLQQLPMGEMTPGSYAKPIGPSQFRLEVPKGTTDPPLRFRRFDYVFEREGCRLLLIS